MDLEAPTRLQLEKDQYILLSPSGASAGAKALRCTEALPHFKVGTELLLQPGQTRLRIVSAFRHPDQTPAQSRSYWLQAVHDCRIDQGRQTCRAHMPGYSLAWITLSDKGARGQRPDPSGPRIPDLVGEFIPLVFSRGFLIADDPLELKGLLITLALEWRLDCICTTGGTGVTSRDITPETTLAVLDRRLPGFEQAMTAASLRVTPHALLSRAVCGVLGRCLIVNLPGSPGGVRDNLKAILPALEHTLKKIHDDPHECHPV